MLVSGFLHQLLHRMTGGRKGQNELICILSFDLKRVENSWKNSVILSLDKIER